MTEEIKKICIKCNIEKNISDFEFRKDTQKYRNVCKLCRYLQKQKYKKMQKNSKEYYANNKDKINERRRQQYQINKDEINAKRRQRNMVKGVQDVKTKIKKQLIRNLDRTFSRKGLKRLKTYNELLCCSVDDAVDYLLNEYVKKYKKELTINDEVDIDHVLGLWSAYRQESVEELCCYKNLRLLSKRDNHNRKYRITNEDQKIIIEYLDFLHEYKKRIN